MIEVNKISKSFGDKTVLKDYSLIVNGEIVGVMGESGKGKTTLMRVIAGLDKQDSGNINVTGKIAISFAEPRLFDDVNVVYNTLVPIKKPNESDVERAKLLLEEFGLADAINSYPNELSTGMANRVSMVRVLMSDADNYIFDEPFKSLDDETRNKVIALLKKYLKDKSVIVITHDEVAANSLCDRVLKINDD
ncbi:MAG: ATP-binding cassette domain-containing protein [Clostridia bacterium]|nr:ATP-binding cassette domain-containing protein [Clostridia bacterium]